jgi:MSHA biogenesis protein MshJ
MMSRRQELEQRFAKLSRRERAILVYGGLAAVLLIGFSLADSSLTTHRALQKQIAQARTDIATTSAQTQTIIRQLAEDPDERARAMIAKLGIEVRDLDAQMEGINRGLVPPQRMAKILEQMLARNAKVRLVALKTLPVSFLIERDKTDDGANVYKHGIELTMQGRYLDLLGYLDSLEDLPWQMFWAHASMNAQEYQAVRLTVTVYTLSLDKNWLVV